MSCQLIKEREKTHAHVKLRLVLFCFIDIKNVEENLTKLARIVSNAFPIIHSYNIYSLVRMDMTFISNHSNASFANNLAVSKQNI